MSGLITQWSYSTWQTYTQCPRKLYYKKVLKLKEPESPQMLRGTRIHKIAEDFVMHRSEALFDDYGNDLGLFRRQLEGLRLQKVGCELEWGFTRTWQPTAFDAKDAWLRVKTDVLVHVAPYTMRVIDYKTGKIYEDHIKQLELYALCSFLKYPHASLITAHDWYLDQDAANEREFRREQVAGLKVLWEQRVEALLHDEIFACRPGPLCNWCHFRKSNSGPCSF